MLTSLTKQNFNCITDYAIETLNSVNLDRLKSYFDNLPIDPYLEDNYRLRRFSHFRVTSDQVMKLSHGRFFQSKEYNPLLGDVIREYPEIDDTLIELEDFQKIVREFFEFCKLCSTFDEIGVHQIRTTTSDQKIGNPAPEGIHRDGVDLVGIFCVNRENIEGGETHLYKFKDEPPVFTQILNKGDFLIFNDRQFLHYTSAIKVKNSKSGIRDVFVFTCPGLIAMKSKP
ncbi:2OG-Fe dioxygenase family protein [Aetokthonos hydrillicola Thurmond2011]|uniref:2OG-Fe dioxygenase family protein n=1 Tax=Aetokthonos hydrillicola Thurmond2011 TaxID=2712845 RepID=A0AAP5M6T2_9CYAN|nr:2OG-Fe dioxygenase family protein [Aetokthonos hydrillicola]MBO3461443.1 2OG-Fe dioxygenase family protein [Aetokthonos hydrillicola CCALA 1050]MBW4588785.1 2OG-Fe dioxygenase family protein [Aetokthonos hydrillicola CCALA 1050]MDR9897351.1 2OG-Fe dioxygenase family protein [Aetokthonos hydrillicola Thurmond2011]